MGRSRTCCVPFCRSGLRSSRKRKKTTAHSRVCSFHFLQSDFTIMRSDSNKWRTTGTKVKQKLLKKSAIPTVFPNYPSYMQATHSHERSNLSSSSKRLERENERVEHQYEAIKQEDVVCDLETLKSKFHNDSETPSEFILYPYAHDKRLLFLKITVDPVPKICKSVMVYENLEFVAHDENGKIISSRFYEHSMEFSHKIIRYSDFHNLLAALGNSPSCFNANEDTIETVVILLNSFIDSNENLPYATLQKLLFIIEQLQLICHSLGPNRRYSTSLMTLAVLWRAHTTACYKAILSGNVLRLLSLFVNAKLSA